MIKLPDGFDYNLLLSDLWSCIIPFITISLMFVAARMIMKAFNP